MYNDLISKFINYKPNRFSDYLSDFVPEISPVLISILKETRVSTEKNKHKDLKKYLYGPLKEYFANAGKMHRPLTCIASYLACGGDIEKIQNILYVSLSLEIFQAGALIHDDIADKSQLRRGKPCMHITQGEGVAINAGDLCLFMVQGSLLNAQNEGRIDLHDDILLHILKELTCMEYATVEGQALDLGWARDDVYDISAQDYYTMAYKKTAYYSAAIPCVLGAICAGASHDAVETLREFGMKIGLSFQIQDDILNLTNKDCGKDFCSDVREGKRTLCVVHALSNSEEYNRKKLEHILSKSENSDSEIDSALCIIQEAGSIDYAKSEATKLANTGNNLLDGLNLNCWKNVLSDMTDWAMSRNS